MKKLLLTLFTAILIFAAVFAVSSAEGFIPDAAAAEIIESGTCGENVTWTLDDEGTLTISGEGTLPSQYWFLDNVKKVVIGSEITEIGRAFYGFYSDFEVVFEEGSKLETIGAGAFESTYVTKITIPASVTSIGENAFWGSGPLEEVIFEEGSRLESIGKEAFCHTGINEIVIPSTVSSIGEEAFRSCEMLSTVTFEEDSSLEAIGKYAFSNSGITEIIIPASVATVEEGAFCNCDSLERVEFEENAVLEELGADTDESYYYLGIFEGCEVLVEVKLPESITFIGTDTFKDCYKLESVNLEECNNLTGIGFYAFSFCESLSEIVIPENVDYVGQRAFEYCSGATSLTFAEDAKIKHLDRGAFMECGIEAVEIPASMEIIGTYAFDGCAELKTVTFEENGNLDKIGNSAFEGTGIITIEIPSTIQVLFERVFKNCKNLVSVSFEENSKLKAIGSLTEDFSGDGVFFECSALVSVALPESLEVLGAYTFYNCTALETVNFEDLKVLGSIGRFAFSGCEKLDGVKFPDSLSCIGQYAFYDCASLSEIEILEGIEVIERSAFSGCINLSEVIFAENIRLEGIENSAFSGCISLTDIQLPDGLITIGAYAFEGCTGITEIELPETVEYVGECAFAVTSIRNMYIPASVSYFGFTYGKFEKFIVDSENPYYTADENGVLYTKDMKTLVLYPSGCSAKEFVIPDGVEIIGELSFVVFENLEKVIMPDSVTELAPGSFAYALSLKEIELSENLDYIGDEAFILCFSLEHIEIPASVTKIGTEVFAYAFSLKEARVYSRTVDLSDSWLGALPFSYESEEVRDMIAEAYRDFYYMEINYDIDYIVEKYGSLEEFEEYVSSLEDYIINEIKTDAYTVYIYEGSAAETYVKENNIKYAYLCDHVEEIIPAVAPGCDTDGATAGVKCSVCGDILVAPEKEPMTGHTSADAVKEKEVKASCKVAAYYEDVVYCSVCGDELSRTPVNGTTVPHTEEVIKAVAPTCTKDGTTAGVKCSVCGDILVTPEREPMTGHKTQTVDAREPEIGVPGYTGDTVCSVCGDVLERGEEIPALEDDTVPECDHICHKDGVLGILWRIISFFAKLFKVNPVCECGAAHY